LNVSKEDIWLDLVWCHTKIEKLILQRF